MTTEEKFKIAAKAAIIGGLGLLVMSVLAITQVAPLGTGAQNFAPFGVLLGAFNILFGISKLRGRSGSIGWVGFVFGVVASAAVTKLL